MVNNGVHMKKQCIKIKSNGEQCKSYSLANSDYCLFHDPKAAKEMRKLNHQKDIDKLGKEVEYFILTKYGSIRSSVSGKCPDCDKFPKDCRCSSLYHQKDLYEYIGNNPAIYLLEIEPTRVNDPDFKYFALIDTHGEWNDDIKIKLVIPFAGEDSKK